MKVSRRALVGATVLVAMFGQGLALADGPAQKQSDTLIYLHSIEPSSLFQWWTQATYPKRQILDSLVYLDEKKKLHAWLAKSWVQHGTTWTFKLRDDVVFTDGSKLDAATVVKNFYFWKKLSTSVADSFFKDAKAIDEHTVQFQTTYPQPYLADLLSSALFGINSAPSLDRDLKELGEKPIGSGPFYLKQWKHGEEIVFLGAADVFAPECLGVAGAER